MTNTFISQSGSNDKFEDQARMLANKVKKRFRHLYKRFSRQGIDVFRLYDWDIPEIRAVVDWYAGHLVIGEYTRKQSVDHWLPLMGDAVAQALNVPPGNLHLKRRYYGEADGHRYERIDHTNELMVVHERDMTFLVNPYDYVDTGLFADHRDTRQMVRSEARGKDFLNLYCYSGAFSCAAALGGARSSTSVDRSQTSVTWTRRNLTLNGISATDHQVIQFDVPDYLSVIARREQRFDLAVVDPPSFSTRKSRDHHFDILTDHPALLSAVAAIIRTGGVIYFSTNHQKFVPAMGGLAATAVEEITEHTIPEDYRSKHKPNPIHRCWRIIV